MGKKYFDVVALGEVLIDMTFVGNDENDYPILASHPGGAPANFLAALSCFGAKTAFIGKVGNDTFGKKLIDTIANANIDISNVIVDNARFTTLAFVTLDNYGNREFSFSRKPGADTGIFWDEIDKAVLENTKCFHFGTLSLTDEPSRTATINSVNLAKKNNVLISFDPNLRIPLWNDLNEAKKRMLWGLSNADIIKISDEEVEFLFNLPPEQGVDFILENFPIKLVYVTCGANGCFFANKNGHGYFPAISNINVVDTTGAGDIFGGSALYKMLQFSKDPDELSVAELFDIVKFASVVAGLSTQKSGGISSLPTSEEVYASLTLL